MELEKYIRLKKDFINSEIMELAAESALLRLIRRTGKNIEELCQPIGKTRPVIAKKNIRGYSTNFTMQPTTE